MNNLRKNENFGKLAKEIVSKWKKLLEIEKQQQKAPSRHKQNGNGEYDPSANWEMHKEVCALLLYYVMITISSSKKAQE